jgi:transcriptional repressor NrdR
VIVAGPVQCPLCDHPESRVVDSRDAGEAIRRRRECETCSHRFTTFERIEYRLPVILKRDGRKQPFSREKLLSGLRLACRKRPVTAEQLEDVVVRVERELSRRADREVPTSELGDIALSALRDLDAVAYLRFASVYRAFEVPEDFLNVVGPLVESLAGSKQVDSGEES